MSHVALVLIAFVVVGVGGGCGFTQATDEDASSVPVTDASASDGDAAGSVDASSSGCAVYRQPSVDELRASSHKVFAHYFSPYPLSLDNAPVDNDYYARNYLQPDGEGGAFAFCGGLLRERPLTPPPWPSGSPWEVANFELEVRRAIAIGLDGFTYDVLNPNSSSAHRQRLDDLLQAAQQVDPQFKVQLVPDMTATSFGGGGGSDATAMAGLNTLLDAVGAHPSVDRLPDGRVILSIFAAERRTAAFWTSAISQMASRGHQVALIPMPVGSWQSNRDRFNGVPLYGASSWGTRTVNSAGSIADATALAHADGLIWMAPVAPQDSRPKNLLFTESDNSAAFRAQWQAAITSNADWVQLITWNDYSENSQMSPSSRTQFAFFDLSGFFITWFKTGAQPEILQDTLYYVHRAHSMDPGVAAPDLSQQQRVFQPANGPTTSTNQIELIALLTAPGTLVIDIAGQHFEQQVASGVQTLTAPLLAGTPTFRLVRDDDVVVEFSSSTTIDNNILYQDPLYHAGGSSNCSQLADDVLASH